MMPYRTLLTLLLCCSLHTLCHTTRLITDEDDLLHSVSHSHHHQHPHADDSLLREHGRCEPITVEICAGKWYNQTTMPNLLGHQKQDEVGMELMQFMPLIKVNCSEDIHLFLCSIYVPMCSVLEEPIPPCRSLCESARRCEDIMRKFEHSWPENLECSKFPTQDEQICFAKNTSGGSDRPMGPSPPGGGASGPLPTSGGSYIEGGGMTSIMANAAANGGGGGGRGGSGSGIRRITIGNKNHQQQPVSSNNGPFRNIGFVCPLQLKAPPGMGYQLNIGGKVRQRGKTVLCLVSAL